MTLFMMVFFFFFLMQGVFFSDDGIQRMWKRVWNLLFKFRGFVFKRTAALTHHMPAVACSL